MFGNKTNLYFHQVYHNSRPERDTPPELFLNPFFFPLLFPEAFRNEQHADEHSVFSKCNGCCRYSRQSTAKEQEESLFSSFQ